MHRVMLLCLYFLFILVIVILAYNAERFKDARKGKKFLRLAFFLLWAFFTFSGVHVGTDALEYKRLFLNSISDFNNLFFHSDMEPLFFVFNACIRFFTDSFVIYKGICGAIIFGLTYSTTKFFKDKVNLTFLLLVFTVSTYFDSFNLIRLYLAFSIILFGLRYIYQGKYLKYSLFCVIAVCFHFSALVPILISFLIRPILKKPLLMFLILLSSVLIFIITFNISKRYITIERYQYYLDITFENIISFWFAPLLPFIYFLFYFRCKKQTGKEIQLYKTFAVIYIIIIFLSVFLQAAARLKVYYYFPLIIFLSVVLKNNIFKGRKVYYSVLTVWFVFWFVYSFFSAGAEHIFFWS